MQRNILLALLLLSFTAIEAASSAPAAVEQSQAAKDLAKAREEVVRLQALVAEEQRQAVPSSSAAQVALPAPSPAALQSAGVVTTAAGNGNAAPVVAGEKGMCARVRGALWGDRNWASRSGVVTAALVALYLAVPAVRANVDKLLGIAGGDEEEEEEVSKGRLTPAIRS